MQKIICALSMLCFFACNSDAPLDAPSDTPLLTCQQIDEQLEVIKNDWMVNKWYIIVEIISPEIEIIEEIIVVEKSRTSDFKLTYFVNVDVFNNIDNNNIKLKKNQKTIAKNNKKHKMIKTIEHIKTKLFDDGSILGVLDGYLYKMEINTITAKTIMEFGEDSFESDKEPIKTWIDNVRSLKK